MTITMDATTTASTYQAVKHELNQAQRPGGLLPNDATSEQVSALYAELIALYPVGTQVRAVYRYHGETRVYEGVVSASAAINIHEPDFHIDLGGSSILLPGSLLTAL